MEDHLFSDYTIGQLVCYQSYTPPRNPISWPMRASLLLFRKVLSLYQFSSTVKKCELSEILPCMIAYSCTTTSWMLSERKKKTKKPNLVCEELSILLFTTVAVARVTAFHQNPESQSPKGNVCFYRRGSLAEEMENYYSGLKLSCPLLQSKALYLPKLFTI